MTAHSLLEKSVMFYREMGHRYGTAESLAVLGKVEARQGDYAAARSLYEESLTLSGALGEKWVVSQHPVGLGEVVAAQGQLAWAAQLWGASEVLRDAIGVPISPVELADYEHAVSYARVHLGEKAFATAWAQGRSMKPSQGQPHPLVRRSLFRTKIDDRIHVGNVGLGLQNIKNRFHLAPTSNVQSPGIPVR